MSHLLELSAQLATAYVSHNAIPHGKLPELILSIHSTLVGLTQSSIISTDGNTPAVPINRSVEKDYIICLEDGKRLKTLKRYLRSQYGMTPEEYRAKWNLPATYPMVAPAYASRRSELAKEFGLGRRPAPVFTTKVYGRRKIVGAKT
jgi:predicted transcriptional regulator